MPEKYANVSQIQRFLKPLGISENTMAYAVAAIDRTMHSNDLRDRVVAKADEKTIDTK